MSKKKKKKKKKKKRIHENKKASVLKSVNGWIITCRYVMWATVMFYFKMGVGEGGGGCIVYDV